MNTKRNRSRGKNTERYIAKRFNGERVGIFGGEDVKTENFSIEVKNRVKSTAHGFMSQCVTNSIGTNRLPVVIIHKHGDKHGDDLVCMRLKDFESWNGELKIEPKEA